MKLKLLIGADHAGYDLKELIKSKFSEIEFLDKGCHSKDSVDYPDFAHVVAHGILHNEAEFGILICGSGNGISIAANKHHGIRSAIAWKAELAALARQHNNANILSLPARFISAEEAFACINTFLSTSFEGGRHEGRVAKIDGN